MALVKKSAFFSLIFSLLLCMSVAYAASFDVEVVPIKDRIVINEFATFQLNIKNNLDRGDEYRIYALDFPTWDVRTEPIVNPITLELGPESDGSVELVLDPLKIKDIGAYQINVKVRSKVTDQFVSVPLTVTILSTEPLIGGYIPTVVTGIDIPLEIDPRKEVSIKIILNNQNIIDYPDLIIKMESSLIKDKINTQLGPKEEKTIDLTANLDPLTPPQEDRLVLAIFKENRSIINPITRDITIIEYAAQKLVSEEKNFLRAKSHYDFASNNKEYTGTFKIETTSWDAIFSSTNPKAKIVKEDGKKYFVGNIKLEDGRMQITVTKNFVPLFIAIVLLIALVIAYYMLRAPLFMIKEASNIVKSEGGITEMTVILHVRNRSNSKISGIEVSDYIPSLVGIGSDVPIGSLQPAKVLRHEKKGTTIVKWTLDALNVSEERVLSYRIKSKLPILGSFSLPAAKATFGQNNKTVTSTSNRLGVGGDNY